MGLLHGATSEPKGFGKRISIPAGFKNVLIQILGVCLTAALVISNKLVMQVVEIPGKHAALTAAHFACTFIYVRVTRPCSGTKVKHVPLSWLLFIAFLGTVSVASSNLLLHLSSITFHQLSKLVALPTGALIDFMLYGTRRSRRDIFNLVAICYGVYLASTGVIIANFAAVAASLVHLFAYLSVAACMRAVCQKFAVTTSEYLYVSSPWGLLSSLLIWLVFAWMGGSEKHSVHSPLHSSASLAIVANCFLAVSVQWFSTWTAGNSSTMLYAVVGQAKTAATVMFGLFIFGGTLSLQALLGLSICSCAAFSLALVESFDLDLDDRNASHTSNVCNTLVAVLLLISLSKLAMHNDPAVSPGSYFVSLVSGQNQTVF